MKYFFLIFILITTLVQAQIYPPNDTIPNNIFPLIPGRTFHYTGYLTQLDTEVKVFETDSTGIYLYCFNRKMTFSKNNFVDVMKNS